MRAAHNLTHFAGLHIYAHFHSTADYAQDVTGSAQGSAFQRFIIAEYEGTERPAPLDVSVGTSVNERPVFDAKGLVFHAHGSFQGLFNGIRVQSVRDGKLKTS